MSHNKLISRKAGLPPGSLIHLGDRLSNDIKISVYDYTPEKFDFKICQTIQDCVAFKSSDSVSWINIDGLHDIEAHRAIGEMFGLHPLLLEDILNTNHRPKVELYDHHIFMVIKMLSVDEAEGKIDSEQVSLVMGKGWILSFQEREGDIFNDIRQKIKEETSNIRKYKADYLFYRMLDTVVDHYFYVTEYFNDAIETLEEDVLKSPDHNSLLEIQSLKRELIDLRKATHPLRDAVSTIVKDPNAFILPSTIPYLRDVQEHVIHVIDSIERQRDMVKSVMDLHVSSMSNKMNEVMKVLTIIATIFIPLTFIVGVYGMNFEFMPELEWKYGYFVVMSIMILMIIVMITYFKRKKWL